MSRIVPQAAARLAVVVASVAVVVTCAAGPASAHASLDASTPASGAVLSEGPGSVVLDFDEPVSTDLGGVELTQADGTPVEVPVARIDPEDRSRVVVDPVPDLADGVYVVVWNVSSADGHPARGAFTFQVGTAGQDVDADALVEEALAGGSVGRDVTWPLGIARFLAFVGLCLLVGVWAMDVITAGRRRAPGAPARVIGAAAVLVVASALAGFALQGAYLSQGTVGDAFDPRLWDDVAGTRQGALLLARVVLALVAWVSVRRAAGRGSWAGMVVVSTALVATFSGAGHPSATSPATVAVLVDMLHLGAVCLWLGGLVWVVTCCPRDDGDAVGRFSTLATVSVPVVVVTGGWQTWHLLGSLDDVTSSDWGRALLVKVSVAVVLVTLGGISRWLLRHDGPSSIRRLVVTEIVVGGVVLAVTAGLVASPPVPPVEAQVVSATLAQGGLLADVSVTPARIGSNEIHVVITPPGGALRPVVSAEARIALPSADIPAVPVELVADGPNHYVGTVQIPSAGDWRLELVVVPAENQTLLLSTSVPVAG